MYQEMWIEINRREKQQIKKSGTSEDSAGFGQRDCKQTKDLQVTHRLTHAQVSGEQQLSGCDVM